MTQEEFDKVPLLDQILYDTTGMLVENHSDIAEAMEKYHEAKLKLLGIADVSNCKPTAHEKNNLPIDVRHAYCEAVEISQHICSYENGIIPKDEFISKMKATKRQH